jgi:ATP-binding cassette, subfamily B, bacterial
MYAVSGYLRIPCTADPPPELFAVTTEGESSVRPFRVILRYAWRQPLLLVLAPVLTLIVSALGALQPWPLKILTDYVLGDEPLPGLLNQGLQHVGIEATPGALVWLVVAGGLGIFLATAAADYGLILVWTRAGRRMVYALSQDLFARMQRRSLTFHRRHSAGDLLQRVTGDSWVVYKVVDTMIFSPAQALIATAGIVVVMWNLDVLLTVVSLITPPLLVAVSIPLGRRIHAAAVANRETEVHLQSHVQQTLSGISVVQAFAQEGQEREKFNRFADDAVRAKRRSAWVNSLTGLNQGLTATIGSGTVLWLGVTAVAAERITIGSLLVFLVYGSMLQNHLRVFATLYTTRKGTRVAADRVVEILSQPAEVTDRPDARGVPDVRGEVTFEQVSFGYDPKRPVLKDLSFTVQPGQRVALVGPTGAGKSTLVSLIPRFFDPDRGRVLVDRRDVRELKLMELRRYISVVLQGPFLFPLSIANNIAYGRPEAAFAEIEAAARAANAHDFISRLPEGYHTVIGERGGTLSGGERQRLSIARALLKDAPILILDEPTSALDAQTEADLMEAVERLMHGRTTFIIAHRLSTIREADSILVLDGGRIVESGTHTQLLRQQSLYAKLHDLQTWTESGAAQPAVREV